MASKCESWMILGLLIAISFSSMHMDMAFAARNLLQTELIPELQPVVPPVIQPREIDISDLPPLLPVPSPPITLPIP
ncbi:hypothetical protein AAZX31_08G065800 [Glycine max]|uniref:Uncharacterized protein n=1 Tax=Glycine max TaxID=3847 RepID=K7KYR4_SOYBN|nr:hypothetical protein GLYMA_08G067741v4 [Glycine max]KAG5024753.1 hypothetical protein JHK86_020667 [Glycine max]KAG5135923.1 hypothetical protein JHK82_020654 [Glycine max]